MKENTIFENFLFGEGGIEFLPEIALRTAVIFFILLFSLRVLGKRGVRQLSVFEMAIIISLGSAAGDPMIYKEIGVLMATTVFISVVICYRVIVGLVGKSKKVEQLIEGRPICLIRDGMFSIKEFSKETMAQDEFFAELREQHVEHLGQLRLTLVETSGEMSLFFFEDERVRYGLPIIPEIFEQKSKIILKQGYYSCAFCGLTEILEPKKQLICERCAHDEWVASINSKRVS